MPQKGFDLLIDALAQLPRGSVRVVVIGDGPERAALTARVASFALQGDIRFIGFHPNPYAFMKRAHALVLSSRYEGLPNVVIESLAIGTAVIAVPCPGGTREIASHTGGVTLASTVSADALAAAIRTFRLLRDASGGQAPPIDIERYRAANVVGQYEALLADAVRIAPRAVGG